MGKWFYTIALIFLVVAIAVAGFFWVFPDFWRPPPVWVKLLYPNGGEAVSGIVSIRWDTNQKSKDKIWIGWSHDVRGNPNPGDWPYPPEVFRHENSESWEGCYCQEYHVITDSAPNTGEYIWNATEVLEQCSGEWYPYYIKIECVKYMDASNTFFNITSACMLFLEFDLSIQVS